MTEGRAVLPGVFKAHHIHRPVITLRKGAKMSIKKTRPKTNRPSSNLTVRMLFDRMGSDKMMDDRGPGSLGSIKKPAPSTGQTNVPKKTEQ
jgi:hypothetical protein